MQDKCCITEHEIICPTCRNKIQDPHVIRCPRCYTLLLKTGCSGGCKGCGSNKKGRTA